MSQRFKNKIGIITGAGQGIGLAIAQRMIAEGARLVINDVDSKILKKACEALGEVNCIAVPGDASEKSLTTWLRVQLPNGASWM